MFHDNLPPLTGEEFRRLREYFGLSQENAARLLNMSSKSQISRMERKKQELVPANIVQNFVQGLTETGGAAEYAPDAINRIKQTMEYEKQLKPASKTKENPMEQLNDDEYTRYLTNEVRKGESKMDKLESRNYNLTQELQDERLKNMQVIREVDHMKYLFENFQNNINGKIQDQVMNLEIVMDEKLKTNKEEIRNLITEMVENRIIEFGDEIQLEIDRVIAELRKNSDKESGGLSGLLDKPGVSELLKSLGENIGPSIAPKLVNTFSNMFAAKQQQAATPMQQQANYQQPEPIDYATYPDLPDVDDFDDGFDTIVADSSTNTNATGEKLQNVAES